MAQTSVCGFPFDLAWRDDPANQSHASVPANAVSLGSLTDPHRLKSVLLKTMLKIGQLAQIKSDSPYVYEVLTQLVNGVNAVGRATGVDPSGSIAAPSPIGSLNVTAADGIFDLAITDNSTLNRGIFYFAESDTTPAFAQPYVHFLGSSRNLRISMGNQTLYWRAYSQYLGSETSEPVTFGTPPTAVTGGGTAAGPALQPSSGSGTASGSEGGSGFGQVAQSSSGPVILR